MRRSAKHLRFAQLFAYNSPPIRLRFACDSHTIRIRFAVHARKEVIKRRKWLIERSSANERLTECLRPKRSCSTGIKERWIVGNCLGVFKEQA
jgi:hypothetical protein